MFFLVKYGAGYRDVTAQWHDCSWNLIITAVE